MDISLITIVGSCIVAFITAVFGPVAAEWAKKRFSPYKLEDPVGEAIKINEKIDEQLENIMEKLECDRIWVSQFHNGGYFYPTGKSIQKFSIFYEKVSPNATSIKETYQNIPVSLFPKLFSKLYTEGEIIIHRDELDGSNTLFSFDQNSDHKSSVSIAVTSPDDHFIGVLSISFLDKKHDFIEHEWDYIRQKTGILGTMLNNYLSNSKK